jgi:hypothetical protein
MSEQKKQEGKEINEEITTTVMHYKYRDFEH